MKKTLLLFSMILATTTAFSENSPSQEIRAIDKGGSATIETDGTPTPRAIDKGGSASLLSYLAALINPR